MQEVQSLIKEMNDTKQRSLHEFEAISYSSHKKKKLSQSITVLPDKKQIYYKLKHEFKSAWRGTLKCVLVINLKSLAMSTMSSDP